MALWWRKVCQLSVNVWPTLWRRNILLQRLFSWLIRTNIYTQGTKNMMRFSIWFRQVRDHKYTSVPVWVPVDVTVETFPLLPSCSQTPSKHFFCSLSLFVYSVSLPLKSMWIAPLKFPRGPVDMLSPRWGHPVHTQVPWWCTMCLRCFRPRPLSLKSVTRCCDVSTRALAIAIPGNPERTQSYCVCVCMYIFIWALQRISVLI